MSRVAKYFLLVIAPALAILLALLGLETLRANPTGWFLLLVGLAYAIGVIIVYYVRKERFWEPSLSGITTHEEVGDRSYWLFSAGMLVQFYLPPVEYLFFPAILPRIGWMASGGLALIFLGVALLVVARRILGRSYSGHLSVKQGQPLVQNGPYRLIRHPAYAGYLLMALGISLGYSSLSGLLAVPLLLMPTLIYRMRVEEQGLIDHFGDAYRQYTCRTKRLIPGIW